MPFIQKIFFTKTKERIIPFLCTNLNLSPEIVKRLIDKKRVYANNTLVLKKSQTVQAEIKVTLFEHIKSKIDPIFIHKDFVIYDKPSGLLVHPQKISTDYTLLDDIKYSFGENANIVHRIDKETSGLVLVSRNKKSERFFKIAFDERKIYKTYLAFVKGKIDKPQTIDVPILKFRDLSARLNPISKDGRASKTIIEPIEYFFKSNTTLIKAIPITGRTHQIRIHLWHIGHQIAGEPLYGHTKDFRDAYLEKRIDLKSRVDITGAKRLLLHANELKFEYDGCLFNIFSKKTIRFS